MRPGWLYSEFSEDMAKSAELAHYRHTKTGTKFPHFGSGEVTNEALARVTARVYFLETAIDLYPDMLAEMKRLAASLPRLPFGPAGFWNIPGENEDGSPAGPQQNVIAKLCRRWGLICGRELAGWACEAVADAAARFQRRGQWYWIISTPGTNLTWESAADRKIFNPEVSRLKVAKQRMPRRLHARLTAIMDVCRRRGLIFKTRTPLEHIFEWAARHQVEGVTYQAIASKYPAPVGYETVKHEVTELTHLIGLQRPPGRPRKPARK